MFCQRPRKHAFSLSEVLLALWLLTFIGGALIATFAYLAKTRTVSSDQASAELLAGEILERAEFSGPPGWGQESNSGTRRLQAGNGAERAFDWTLETELVDSGDLGEFYELRVLVSWKDYKDGVEQGRRELTRARHVYLDDL